MNEIIKEIDKTHLKQALNLVNEVFAKFVAVDYSEQGKVTFENYLHNKYEEIFTDLQTRHKKIWACFRREEILGVISIRDTSHISLLFVDERCHKQGIARRMFNIVLEEIKKVPGITQITVNSSPYAVEVYKHLGFEATGERQEKDGMVFIPMRRTL